MTSELISREQRPPGTVNKDLPGEDRQTVESLFTQFWGERCVSVFVTRYDPLFKVEGLRRDGSEKGKKKAEWLLERGVTVFTDLVTSSSDRRYGSYAKEDEGSNTLGNGRVEGTNDSMAVRIATSTVPGTKWLTWSANHIALFDYDADDQLGVRWHAAAPDLPTYQRTRADIILTWPDNSTYSFKLGIAEANRLGQIEAGETPSDPYAINNPILDKMRGWSRE